jgi:tRNA (mo5U34)-methyltransferase
MEIGELFRETRTYGPWLNGVKEQTAAATFWYPFRSLGNFELLDRLLPEPHRDVSALAGGKPIADIGAGDGDVSFFLESQGFDVHLIDWPATNHNRMRGARRLQETLDSKVDIYEIDLDRDPTLPGDYGLVLFLGILYHLKSPLGVLEALARQTDHLVMSTKVARRTPGGKVDLTDLPVGYLVGSDELNADNTNFWVFSETGLQRLIARAGWELLASMSVGNTVDSEPAGGDKDERAFCLLRSTRHQS